MDKRNVTAYPRVRFKNAGKKKLNFNTSGNLLLVEHGYSKHDATYDKKSDFIEYLDNQKTFVDNLHKNPRKNLLIRLFNINFQKEIGVKRPDGMILIQILK